MNEGRTRQQHSNAVQRSSSDTACTGAACTPDNVNGKYLANSDEFVLVRPTSKRHILCVIPLPIGLDFVRFLRETSTSIEQRCPNLPCTARPYLVAHITEEKLVPLVVAVARAHNGEERVAFMEANTGHWSLSGYDKSTQSEKCWENTRGSRRPEAIETLGDR